MSCLPLPSMQRLELLPSPRSRLRPCGHAAGQPAILPATNMPTDHFAVRGQDSAARDSENSQAAAYSCALAPLLHCGALGGGDTCLTPRTKSPWSSVFHIPLLTFDLFSSVRTFAKGIACICRYSSAE